LKSDAILILVALILQAFAFLMYWISGPYHNMPMSFFVGNYLVMGNIVVLVFALYEATKKD